METYMWILGTRSKIGLMGMQASKKKGAGAVSDWYATRLDILWIESNFKQCKVVDRENRLVSEGVWKRQNVSSNAHP